jgi:rhodanese-related sulfurtransferase
VVCNSSYASGWQAPIVLDGATPITAQELVELMKGMGNIVLLDNRDAALFEQSRIKGSISLSYTDTSPGVLTRLAPDKQTPLVFYCEDLSCPHSVKAIRKAVNYGYITIFWLRGGIAEWKQQGLPLVTGPVESP